MHILMFSNFDLPHGCANATRVFALAQLLSQCGHEVSLVGVSYRQGNELRGVYKGFDYELLQALPYYGFEAHKRVTDLKRKIAAFLAQKQEEKPIDAILLSDIYFDFSSVFLSFSKKYNVSLIVNAVEWYDKGNELFKGVRGKINFVKNRIALLYIHRKMKNILAISSLLNDYYETRGCNTVTVPTIVDLHDYEGINHTSEERDTIHIAYAGMPGKKDYIINAIHALMLLEDDERARLQLHFYGPTVKQLNVLGVPGGLLDALRENVVCHGRIPYEDVKSRIADADFTVLLRPNKRYANAGFPTKVGESMACGTPVIANVTSDLAKYVIDGETGIICADESAASCAEALRRALQMTAAQREIMRIHTVHMSQNAFDYRAHAESVESFLRRATKRG